MTSTITPDTEHARRFFRALGCKINNTRFRTFDDAKRGGVIPLCYPADQFNKLPEANLKGAGVFVVVNETKGDSDKDITKVRAVFVDLDGAPLKPVTDSGLMPHITIESSPGRFHAYWKVTDCPLDRFKPIQQAIAARFNGDKSIINLSRVMRLPGFIHQKKEPFMTRIMEISDHEPFTVQKIIDGLSLKIGSREQANKNSAASDDGPFQGSNEGGRTKAIERAAGILFNKGFSIDEAVSFCETLDTTKNEPPLAETQPGKVRETVEGIHRRYYNPNTWPEPLPLPEGLQPVKRLEPDMIPVPLRGWLMDIADRMQIPPDFSTAAAVVALGSIIGRGCGIYPKRHDDWLVVPNLWGAVVGRPSLMKTPAASEAQRHLVRLETEAREAYQEEARTFELDKEVNKITRAAIGEDIKKAVKNGRNETVEEARARLAALHADEPTRRRFQTQDGTVEKIGELLNENPRGLLVNRDELIGWFRTLDKDGRENDRSFYLEAWNGNRGYTYDRIGRGTLDIQATCLSIFGAITPGPLSTYVYQANRGGNGDDGLLQRFQVIVWPDAPNEWKNIDRFPDTREKNRAWEIFKSLSGDIPGAVKGEGADIPALRFTPGGQEIFDTWRDDLETRLRHNTPALESHLAKYRSLMPSLALIFHVVAIADGATPGPVSKTAAIMAAAWCDYLESHAGRVYGGATTPGMESAREIIKHIERGAIQDGAKFREIHRNQWTRLATPEEVRAGMEVLQEYDWLTVDKITTGGRPSEIVRLNPAIKVCRFT